MVNGQSGLLLVPVLFLVGVEPGPRLELATSPLGHLLERIVRERPCSQKNVMLTNVLVNNLGCYFLYI